MGAKIRKAMYFFLIAVPLFAGIAFFVVANYGKEMFGKDFNSSVFWYPFIACAFLGLFIPLFARGFFKAMDETNYDEFGVRKINRHYMNSEERKIIEAEKIAKMERIVHPEEIKRLTKSGSKDPEKDMEELLGLCEIKENLRKMQARMQFEQSERKSGNSEETKHMCFFGNAGTGKTTVARIVTGLLYDYYQIDENKVIEVDGNYLKARNAEETAIKVKIVTRASYGGVLFVDEAYALMEGDMGGVAIATLIKEMEDNRDKFVLILAGYKREMQELIASNTGFASRINKYWGFEDYSNEELYEIFVHMMGSKGFKVDENCLGRFVARIEHEKSLSSYGNARTVRNIVEESINNHASRFISENLPKVEKHIIGVNDVYPRATNNFF